MAFSIHKYFAGHISRAVLLILLPLCGASFFGSVIAAAVFFPTGSEWYVRVISSLTSPRENPQGYWLPSIGVMASLLLAWPFAGYVAQRLRANTPRLAKTAGLAFAFGFSLLFLAVVAQLAQAVIGLRWLHEFLARVSAGCFFVGMLACCACGLKNRTRGFGRPGSLPAGLTWYWGSLTLLPLGCLACIGALVLLGHQAGLVWAEDLRQSFRHTMMWHLAFWEWVGAVVAYVFLTGSALLLPVETEK